MREIDLESWPRREHYRFFMRMDYPQYNLCFDVDVTKLVPFCKERGLSFYYALLYFSTRAANAVEAFRYRARGDKVVVHDALHPSFTDMSKGDDLFRIVTVELSETLEAFVERAAARSREQVHPFDMTGFEGRDDLIYYTSIPWLSFTQLNHTITHDREDSVPRLSWLNELLRARSLAVKDVFFACLNTQGELILQPVSGPVETIQAMKSEAVGW